MRFEAAIPPGFMDNQKPEPWKFGDLVLWQQIMAYAASVQKPVILITDDQKDDWWYRVDGDKTIIPHPLLRSEFRRETDQSVWFYTTEKFLIEAKSRLGVTVSDETLEEVRDVTPLDHPQISDHESVGRSIGNTIGSADTVRGLIGRDLNFAANAAAMATTSFMKPPDLSSLLGMDQNLAIMKSISKPFQNIDLSKLGMSVGSGFGYSSSQRIIKDEAMEDVSDGSLVEVGEEQDKLKE